MARILLIDDESDFAQEVKEHLEQLGHSAAYVDNAEDAFSLFRSGEGFDLILLDNKMPRMSGLEFLKVRTQRGWHVQVILMTSAHHDATVIQAMELGAFAYVIKPIDVEELFDDLIPVLNEALELARRPAHIPIPKGPSQEGDEKSLLVGRSRPMIDLLTRIGRLARLDETVMILGETGTGKDLVARALHTNSARRNGPYVPLNCSALNEQLLEDELFGHEPGAFTGAAKLRKGRFEHAHGGTLFLDEAGDMPLSLQAKLLRVLENREIVRQGSNDPVTVNVRVLAATHCDLAALVREGKFREDLFYRLEGMTIHIPPLRERREDIELLAHTFLGRMFAGSSSPPALHPAALQKLRAYDWPGNVRQLQKVICRAAGVCRGSFIMPEDIDFGELNREGTVPKASGDSLKSLIESAWRSEQPELWTHLHDLVQREVLTFALKQPGISQVQLARRLGMSRNHLRARLKHFGFTELTEEI